MHKVAIIEKIHQDGINLLKNNPAFEFEIIEDASEENLIKVLPKVEGPITEAHFVYPQSLKNTARVQAFRNFLFSKISEWKF